MLVRFWGTRGSIATPSPATMRYGGNTSCVEVSSDDTTAVLDCGTGARALGARLAADSGPQRLHLLVTHFHWDHIQGFPFFLPAFVPGSEIHLYGPGGLEQGLEEAMSGQMQYTYFPVRLDELRSRLHFHELSETSFSADRLSVSTQYLNHTCPALGYRLSVGGVSVAYVTDHEPFWPHNPEAPLADAFVHPGTQRHAGFVEDVDLLIHDAQYTAAEYPAKRGWGHSTIEYVVDVALAARARRLALFHHDPTRDDDEVEQLVALARARVRQRGGSLEVFAAAEGQELELQETEQRGEEAPSLLAAHPAWSPNVLLIGPSERRRTLRSALSEDGYHIIDADWDSPVSELPRRAVDLVVVAAPQDVDPLPAIEAIGGATPQRPLLAVLDGAVSPALLRRVGDAASDVLVAPYSAPTLRTRVRACLSRRQAGEDRSADTLAATATESTQFLDRLSSAEMETMLLSGSPCSLRPGEVLFYQGDPPGGVYYLHRGLVRIFARASEGREVTVGFLGPGDTVGEMASLDTEPRSATVVAVEPVEATFISRDAFLHTISNSPDAALRLLRMLVRRLRDTDRRLSAETTVPVLSVPRSLQLQVVGAESEAAPRAAAPVPVLLVEDDRVTRGMLSDWLQRRGYHVTALADGEAGWQSALEKAFPLVLLDLGLPGMDGLELCRRIRALRGESCVILITTARDQAEDLHEALVAGADDYLVKPVDRAHLDVRLTIAEQQLLRASARQRAVEALGDSERRYRHLVETTQGVLVTHDLRGTLLSVNSAAASALGYRVEEMVGENLGDFLAPAQRHHLQGYLERIRQRPVDRGVLRAQTRGGQEIVWAYQNARYEEPDRGTVVVSHAVDISALEDAYRRLRRQALYDSLTGLPNRVLLQDRLTQAIRLAEREQRALAVCAVGLTGLKPINDAHGHKLGDRILKEAGLRLRAALRTSDTVARLAGDEFAVILPGVDEEGARRAADKIVQSLHPPFELAGRRFDVESRVGVAGFPIHGRDGDQLLQSANIAMHAAENERNGYAFFSPTTPG